MKDIRYIADMLDSKFKLPNGWRLGWDGILGLIPGIGNMITNFFSFYILFRAALLGCPPAILLRMGFNVFIDNIIDKIPLIGLVFDFIWKANTQNIKLMDQYFTAPEPTNKKSKILVILSLVFLFILFLACVALTIFTVIWVFNQVFKSIPG